MPRPGFAGPPPHALRHRQHPHLLRSTRKVKPYALWFFTMEEFCCRVRQTLIPKDHFTRPLLPPLGSCLYCLQASSWPLSISRGPHSEARGLRPSLSLSAGQGVAAGLPQTAVQAQEAPVLGVLGVRRGRAAAQLPWTGPAWWG